MEINNTGVKGPLLPPKNDFEHARLRILVHDRQEATSLRNESKQSLERLRNRREKNRARRRTKKNTRGKEKVVRNKDHEKQRLATPKRLKQGDEKELESKLRTGEGGR